jgi:hypothetical protein
MNFRTEMFRDGEWVEVKTPPDVQVTVPRDGGPIITINVGHIQPPWRVLGDDEVMFERTT